MVGQICTFEKQFFVTQQKFQIITVDSGAFQVYFE